MEERLDDVITTICRLICRWGLGEAGEAGEALKEDTFDQHKDETTDDVARPLAFTYGYFALWVGNREELVRQIVWQVEEQGMNRHL